MGIPGLVYWLRDSFPDAFASASVSPVDHLFVDMNCLIHEAVRRAHSEDAALAALLARLTQIMQETSPRQSVTLAIDGPAPLAKMQTQRQRRQAAYVPTTAVVSSLAITPGTSFMRLVDEAVLQWAAQAARGPSSPTIIVDPSGREGEGEVKLMRHLRSEAASSIDAETHVVLSNDGDVLLLSLAAPARLILVQHPRTNTVVDIARLRLSLQRALAPLVPPCAAHTTHPLPLEWRSRSRTKLANVGAARSLKSAVGMRSYPGNLVICPTAP